MSRLQANMILLLAAMLWGSSFVVQQIGVGELGTISFTGARFLLGSFLVMPFALRQLAKVQRETRPFNRGDWIGLVVTGTILCAAGALQQYGILHTTVTNSGFLTGLYVPMVPVLALLLLKKTPHFIVWPASIAAFFGTYLMSGAGKVDLAVGDLWVIASTFFWAGHVLMVGYMAMRTKAPLVVACGQFFISGVLGLVLGFIVESPDMSQFASAMYGVLYMGVFSVAGAFTLQVIGQRYTPAPDAAIILSSEAIFAAIGGAIILGERISTIQFSGAILIFVGILAVELVPIFWSNKAKPLS